MSRSSGFDWQEGYDFPGMVSIRKKPAIRRSSARSGRVNSQLSVASVRLTGGAELDAWENAPTAEAADR
jgi:hypothetical protein